MFAQAAWVARVLSGRVSLPNRAGMLADVQRVEQLLRDHDVPLRYWHNMSESMPEDQWVYNDFITAECRHEVPAVSGWRRLTHPSIVRGIFQRPDTFRDVDDTELQELLKEGRQELMRVVSEHAESGQWSYVASSQQCCASRARVKS